MRKKIRYLFKREMLRNLTVLTGGTIIAQAIPIAIAPILSRLYSPDDFGVWALYLSFVMFLSVFSTGRYQFAIMLPKENREAINILRLCFFILIVFCVVLELIIIFLYDYFQTIESISRIDYWIYFLPLSIFLVSSISILNIWNTRYKQYKNIVISKISQTTLTSTVNIYVGMLKNKIPISSMLSKLFQENSSIMLKNSSLGLKGLIGGTIVGQVLGVVVLSYRFIKNYGGLLKEVQKTVIKKSMKRYKDFPTVNVLHASVDNIQSTGVSLIIVHFFTASILGLYSFAYRIIQAPLGMITNSYAQVFFQRSAEMHANGESINQLYKKTLKVFFLMGFPVFLLLAIFGQEIFSFIFGDEWTKAGLYVQILTPWFFMNFLISPMGQIPIILNKQKQVFLLSILGNSMIFLSICVGAVFFGRIEVGFILISVTQLCYYSYLLFWFNRITQ